jgi:hypothetical protein
MYIKFKEIKKKIIGSPLIGGPVGGESVIAHLVAKRYPIGSCFCSSGSFNLHRWKEKLNQIVISE